MNKIDEAWQALRKLAPKEQEQMADVILNFAAQTGRQLQISDEQLADLERRIADKNAETITLEEFRARVREFGS